MRWRLILLASIIATSAHADEFASWNSKHQELKETAILEIGDIEKLQPPPDKQWEYDILKITDICVRLKNHYYEYWGYGKKAGLLVVDKYSEYKVVFIESEVGQKLKVSTIPVEIVDCQTLSNSILSLERLQAEVRKQQAEMKKQLELYRRRREAVQQELRQQKAIQKELDVRIKQQQEKPSQNPQLRKH